MAFRTVIGYNNSQFETGTTIQNTFLSLDFQNEPKVSLSSTIASQPLQSGDTMSDHMYNNPLTVALSGKFSLNGMNWDDISYNFGLGSDRLTKIQNIFEDIKNKGILCTLTTYAIDDEGKIASKVRFKQRTNMALKSITWTQKQNSLDYDFSFQEVIMIKPQEYEDLTEEMLTELNLAQNTYPSGTSLSKILSDTGNIRTAVIQSLYANGYIEDDFLKSLNDSLNKGAAVIAITGAAAAAILATGIIGGIVSAQVAGIIGVAAGATATVVPAGTIIAAAAVLIVGIIIGINVIISEVEKAKKAQMAFKLINGSPDADADRLLTLLEDIELAVNSVESNVVLYEIDQNKTNSAQQVIINIGGEYYYIDFDINNTRATNYDYWYAKIKDMNGNDVSLKHSWPVVTSLNDLNRDLNMFFRINSYEIYLFNPSMNDSVQQLDKILTAEELEEAKQNVAKQLNSYYLLVSKGSINNNVSLIFDTIANELTSREYV